MAANAPQSRLGATEGVPTAKRAAGVVGHACGFVSEQRRERLAKLATEFREIVSQSAASSTIKPTWPEQLAIAHGSESGVLSNDGLGDNVFTGESVEYTFSLQTPLVLGSALSYHIVDDKYLWISTFEGGLLVLDERDHLLLSRLASGSAPIDVLQRSDVGGRPSEDENWRRFASLVGRMAAAGFISGVRGHTECRIPTPEKFARFHLTKACHLECIHCYADSSPRVDRSNELSVPQWLRVLEDFAAQGGAQVLFTGGEALMHRGCLQLLSRAKSLGLYVTLFTNGLLVPRYITEIRDSVDKVQVSLDGPDERSNDAIRGKGVFRAVRNALDALLQAKVPTQIGMTMMEENFEAWQKGFLEFAKQYSNHPIEFRLSYGINTYGRAEAMTEMDVNVTRPVVDALMAGIAERRGPMVYRAQSGCGYAEQLVIGPDGTVYPCHLLDAPVCHINDMPLLKIIETLRNISRRVNVDQVEGCRDCDIRYLCGGTCRVLDGKAQGSRLITTCTPEIRQKKYRALVEHFE